MCEPAKAPQRRDTRVTFDPSFTGGDMAVEDPDDEEEKEGTSREARSTTVAESTSSSRSRCGAQEGEDEEACEVERPRREEKWWATLMAGGIAGAVSRTCVAPLERLKILFQVQGLSAKGAPLRHRGIWSSLANMYSKDGLAGLFKGNGLNCVRVVPSSAIQFASYALYRRALFDDDGSGAVHLSPWQHVVAGGLAGATSTTLTYPLDLMRARRTVDFRGDVPTQLLSGLAHILKTEGVRGLFRGLLPSLCGIVPYIGIDFAMFDLAKRTCRQHGWGLDARNPHDLLPITKVACGAVAGVCGMTVAFPFDTARRNLQVATLKIRDGTPPPTDMFQFMGGIVRDGGVLALYRGLFANYLKAGPSVGISFATFEYVKPILDNLGAEQPTAARHPATV
mmetsp:Transcript_5115/g.15495  ORF Transcript_5115/g.15495 Transcript_5115/m.15495 type:complete len:395 (+) Transcript_5115:101-1285(+)